MGLLLFGLRWKLYSWVIKVPDVDMVFRCCSDFIMVFPGSLLNVNRRLLRRRRFGKTLCKILYLYFLNLFLWLEHMLWVWWPYIFVPLPSTLSYGEGRMWQVTAYRHMICISPLCAISCLTHIYSVYLTLNTTLTLYHIYILYLVTTLRDVLCELRSGCGTEASMTYPNNEPTTSRDD